MLATQFFTRLPAGTENPVLHSPKQLLELEHRGEQNASAEGQRSKLPPAGRAPSVSFLCSAHKARAKNKPPFLSLLPPQIPSH